MGQAHVLGVNLDASYPHLPAHGQNFHFLIFFDFAAGQSPGDDGPESLHNEGAVDGQAQGARGVSRFRFPGHLAKRIFESIQPFSGPSAGGENRRAFEERSLQILLHFQLYQFQEIGFHQV